MAFLTAGCFGGDGQGPAAPENPPADIPVAPTPAGCDPSRPAISYGAGNTTAVLANGTANATIVPCFHGTTHRSYEPSIAIAADGTLILAPIFVVTETAGAKDTHLAMLVSKDEGTTWELRVPDLGEQPAHRATRDPHLYLDPDTGRIWYENFLQNCSAMAWTDDLGDTWEHSVAGCTQSDHVTLFAGFPTTSTTIGYPNVVYRCGFGATPANTGITSVCQRTIDGGRLWVQTGEPVFVTELSGGGLSPEAGHCNMGLGHGVAGRDGTIYVPKGHCGQPWLAISYDEGDSWTRVQVSDLGMSTDEEPNYSVGPLGDHHVGYSEDHDAAVGVDRDGTIYYAWVAKDRLAYLATSRDAGTTWSTPVRVTHPGVNEVWHVEMAVGAPGRVVIAAVGTENGPGAPFPAYLDGSGSYNAVTWNGYMAASFDAKSAQPTFYGSAINDPNDPLVTGGCWDACGSMSDYFDVRIGPDGTPWASFVDDCFDGECVTRPNGMVLAGRLLGVNLWDNVDPNGPYPN